MPAWLTLAALATAVALIAWLALATRRVLTALTLRLRMRRAAHGEDVAERWLAANGYRVLDRQVTRRSTFYVNGEPIPFDVRADLLVERGGDRAIVEVKTGDAADPRGTATRRQLLEYARVFGATHILLFDADRRRLVRVAFES